jgi:hypothetical protein
MTDDDERVVWGSIELDCLHHEGDVDVDVDDQCFGVGGDVMNEGFVEMDTTVDWVCPGRQNATVTVGEITINCTSDQRG